jgi:hypothetical protein
MPSKFLFNLPLSAFLVCKMNLRKLELLFES